MTGPKMLHRQSGNILIYILGSIALIGLLIVAVKGSFQEGTGTGTEGMAILVSRVQTYGGELERAVKMIVQQNGYSETDIRFANDVDSSYGSLTDIPGRQVFSPDGGAAEYKTPPAGSQTEITNWEFNARNAVDLVGTTCAANSCVDLIALLHNVKKEFCVAVNNVNRIDNPSGSPPEDTTSVNKTSAFNGVFSFGAYIDAGAPIRGKHEGCIYNAGKYYYYRVLLAR